MSLAVMITTHNRLEDLKRTLGHLGTLSPEPDEILVTADGCMDGTEQWLREHCSNVRIYVNAPGEGSIASRHSMMLQANSEFVLSLDDDSYPEQLDSLAIMETWMRDHPDFAVLTFPQHSEEFPESLTETDLPSQGFSGSYPNSGACYRRSAYEELPGFNTHFFHQYEESDYALQCIAAGYAVYHSNVVSIRHHYSSVGRNELRTHHRHSRNEFWSTLVRAPWFVIPAVVPFRIVRQMQFAFRHGGVSWIIREPVWWWSSLTGILRSLRTRKPVSFSAYSLWLDLMRHPRTDVEQWNQHISRIDSTRPKPNNPAVEIATPPKGRG